eukprot:2353102-Prymnesium_polylepis.4
MDKCVNVDFVADGLSPCILFEAECHTPRLRESMRVLKAKAPSRRRCSHTAATFCFFRRFRNLLPLPPLPRAIHAGVCRPFVYCRCTESERAWRRAERAHVIRCRRGLGCSRTRSLRCGADRAYDSRRALWWSAGLK